MPAAFVLDGVDISSLPSRLRIRHGVARNFQNIRLMPHLSAIENVLVGQHCRNNGLFGVLQPVSLMPGNRWREEARAALAEAGLERYERAAVGSLPYGVQKRIELVRATDGEAAACFCSTSRLRDSIRAETDALRGHIANICREHGITLLVVEHDMHLSARCATQSLCSTSAAKSPRVRRSQSARMRLSSEAYLGTAKRTRRKAAMRLEVHDLHVRYGRVHAVARRFVAVEPGEIVAVLGANGAGKSSLLKALMGLQPAAGGSVTYAGVDITGWPPSRRDAQPSRPGARGPTHCHQSDGA